MKEHNYTAVRASMEKGVFNHADADTIIHALRFAEKMMQEPSEGMIEMGYKADLNSEAKREPQHIT